MGLFVFLFSLISQSHAAISPAEFEDAALRVERIYAPEIAKSNRTFRIVRNWKSNYTRIDAYVVHERKKTFLELQIYGGFARTSYMTFDAFVLGVCSALGYHLGGSPLNPYDTGPYFSLPGQACYFGTLKCFRRVFTAPENRIWKQIVNVNPVIEQKCDERYINDIDESLACQRAVTAGLTLSPGASPTETDQTIVKYTTLISSAQCLFDTYLNGALCDRPVSENISMKDDTVGTCEKQNGYVYGFRPRCWYKPSVGN